MSTSRIDSQLLNPLPVGKATKQDDAEMRRVASEFESLFLSQITSALNPSPDDEDADLFGSSASQMYRQMLSEQLANSMAKNGGIGLSETILSQLQAKGAAAADGASKLTQAMDAARSIRDESDGATLGAAGVRGITANKVPDEAKVAGKLSRDTKTSLVPEIGKAKKHNSSNYAESPSSLRMPVSGTITSKFGTRRDPIHGQHRNHKGIDIAAPRGTPIESAATGTVVFAGRQGGYGKTVVIELPDGRRTRYAHAEKLLVRQGEQVNAGQVIATVGSTGRATGPHLHFEVTENGQAVNPLQVLAKGSTLARR